jgi:hypothetical protein
MTREREGVWSRLHAVPRGVVLACGAAAYLIARMLSSPRWVTLVLALVVGGYCLAMLHIDALAKLTEAERRLRNRNVAVALALLALFAMFYAATIVRLGPNVLNRPM